MNERIRELIQMADLCAACLMASGATEEIQTRSKVVLAELIVRECAEVAGCNAHVSGFTLGDLIKQHFGVKS